MTSRLGERAVPGLPFASALAALGTADASPAQHHKPLWQHRSKAAEAEGRTDGKQRDAKQSNAARLRTREAHAVVPSVPLPVARPAAASLPPDLATTKVAIELIREGKWKDATAFAASIGDPVARKLVEWALLRHSDSEAGFERYVATLEFQDGQIVLLTFLEVGQQATVLQLPVTGEGVKTSHSEKAAV